MSMTRIVDAERILKALYFHRYTAEMIRQPYTETILNNLIDLVKSNIKCVEECDNYIDGDELLQRLHGHMITACSSKGSPCYGDGVEDCMKTVEEMMEENCDEESTIEGETAMRIKELEAAVAALQNYVNELEHCALVRWISVDEALPQPGKRVLVYGKSRLGEGTLMMIDSYNDNLHDMGLKDWNQAYIIEVTHWMELPGEPREECDD